MEKYMVYVNDHFDQGPVDEEHLDDYSFAFDLMLLRVHLYISALELLQSKTISERAKALNEIVHKRVCTQHEKLYLIYKAEGYTYRCSEDFIQDCLIEEMYSLNFYPFKSIRVLDKEIVSLHQLMIVSRSIDIKEFEEEVMYSVNQKDLSINLEDLKKIIDDARVLVETFDGETALMTLDTNGCCN